MAPSTFDETSGPKPGIDKRYWYSGKPEHIFSICSSNAFMCDLPKYHHTVSRINGHKI
jgi:hypothetical protein